MLLDCLVATCRRELLRYCLVLEGGGELVNVLVTRIEHLGFEFCNGLAQGFF